MVEEVKPIFVLQNRPENSLFPAIENKRNHTAGVYTKLKTFASSQPRPHLHGDLRVLNSLTCGKIQKQKPTTKRQVGRQHRSRQITIHITLSYRVHSRSCIDVWPTSIPTGLFPLPRIVVERQCGVASIVSCRSSKLPKMVIPMMSAMLMGAELSRLRCHAGLLPGIEQGRSYTRA